MASTSASKKRKRDADDDAKVSLALSNQPKSQLGPVLGEYWFLLMVVQVKFNSTTICRNSANFPSIKPSKSTTFKCYQTAKRPEATMDEDEETNFAALQTLIAGETDAIDLYSSDETRKASVGSRYFVGVHDKRTGVTTIRHVPLHTMTHQVKALKSLQPAPVSALERLEARAALGESFGTKKAKQAIKAQERNKVDVSAMETVADRLQESIQRNTEALPSKEEAQATADNTRLVPKYNPDAITASEIYPLHNIISQAEWKALSPTPFLHASTSKERIALLPYQRSSWINQHLNLVCASPSPSKTDIKILLYISAMMTFRNLAFRKFDKAAIQEKLSAVPSVVIDGLFARFTETARGSTQPQSTSQTETLLLTHMFALCLRIDDYATDTSLIANDLSQKVATINTLFKSLGCKITKLTITDLKRLGLPDSAGEVKRAVLKTPLEFPKPRTRRRT
ncbi:Rpa49 subunit specific to nuclear RNA polymerase I [Phlebopus sp. FC_14]|nr:Rpa49 subunit specific to nuclear RNA polymerase I [Phlebopus sp. FC_14]